MDNQFDRLQEQLGIYFHEPDRLKLAFTHSSYVNEQRGELENNERLEFLGDAVLELAVSEYLYEQFQGHAEGELTRIRASIVCEPSLEKYAKSLGFGEFVLLGRGEEKAGGRERPALLADVFEAFIGALYLDQGLEAVKSLLHKVMFPDIVPSIPRRVIDYKSELQEIVQQDKGNMLEYRIVEINGPSHAREFVAEVWVGSRCLGKGSGRSKKEAEQQAAAMALEQLKSDGS